MCQGVEWPPSQDILREVMEGGTGSPDVRRITDPSDLGMRCCQRRAGHVDRRTVVGRWARPQAYLEVWQLAEVARKNSCLWGWGSEMVCRVGCVNSQFERLKLGGTQSC